MSTTYYRSRLSQWQGKKKHIKETIKQLTRKKAEINNDIEIYRESLEVIQTAAIETQKQLQFHIANIVTLCLETIFPESNMELSISFVPKRNKMECDIRLVEDGVESKPIDSNGGGVVDVLSFALRIACWSLDRSTLPVMLLDEPFKHLSQDLLNNAAAAIQEISKQLSIQFIIVTHEKELIGDSHFLCVKKKGKTIVSKC